MSKRNSIRVPCIASLVSHVIKLSLKVLTLLLITRRTVVNNLKHPLSYPCRSSLAERILWLAEQILWLAERISRATKSLGNQAPTFIVIISFLLASRSLAHSKDNSLLYLLQPSVFKSDRQDFIDFLSAIQRSHFVIDYSYDGSDANAWTTDEINQLKNHYPKKIISYISIGEAEKYRYYWKNEWKNPKKRPSFIDQENPHWTGNYKVHYWDPNWQKIVFDYLDRIISAGFDGIYMDIVDAYEYYEYDSENDLWDSHRVNPDTQNSYRDDMISFISKIRAYSKKKNPDFILIAQNGVTLLENTQYTKVIDGIGVEDLLSNGKEWTFQNNYVQHKAKLLTKFKKKKKLVFLVEYAEKQDLINRLIRTSKKLNFPLLITNRTLTGLGTVVP